MGATYVHTAYPRPTADKRPLAALAREIREEEASLKKQADQRAVNTRRRIEQLQLERAARL